MKKLLIFCGLYVLALLLPATAQPINNAVPETFSAQLGGFMGATSYQVTLEGGTLIYRTTSFVNRNVEEPQVTEKRVAPTAAQWEQFDAALTKANVWQWQEDYGTFCCDGTRWQLKLQVNGRQLRSRGVNSYPGAQGEVVNDFFSPPFQRYLKAVSDLVGEPFE